MSTYHERSGAGDPSLASQDSISALPSDLARLVCAVQDLSQARSIETVQEIVRHAARELVGADGATFVLRDGGQCHYVDEDAIAPLWKGRRFPLEACVSGWTMLHRRPAVVEDIFDDPRVPVDAYRATFVKSLVTVPIRSNDPIGAIGTYWSQRHRATPVQIELLHALANTTAVALENVQVYRELEQRVADRTRALQHANEELASFAGSVSHDLRAPLAVIGGYADLLRITNPAAFDGKSREMLEQIPRQVARMSALIDDLLRLSHIREASLTRTPVDLAALARDIAAGLAARESARVVEFVTPPALPARGDAPLLRIALENLLANAWKYTGRAASPRVEFGRTVAPDATATFFVHDNGAGFDMAQAAQLFTPFHRLHSASEFAGTGVGLTIVARIIERHGGRVWAESSPGAGATFFFVLGDGT